MVEALELEAIAPQLFVLQVKFLNLVKIRLNEGHIFSHIALELWNWKECPNMHAKCLGVKRSIPSCSIGLDKRNSSSQDTTFLHKIVLAHQKCLHNVEVSEFICVLSAHL